MVDSSMIDRVFASFLDKSSKKIADQLGKGDSTVRGWRAGRSLPTISDLVKISEVTGKSLDWLITGKEADGVEPGLTPAQSEVVEACCMISARLLKIQGIALSDPVAAEAAAGVLAQLRAIFEKSSPIFESQS